MNKRIERYAMYGPCNFTYTHVHINIIKYDIKQNIFGFFVCARKSTVADDFYLCFISLFHWPNASEEIFRGFDIYVDISFMYGCEFGSSIQNMYYIWYAMHVKRIWEEILVNIWWKEREIIYHSIWCKCQFIIYWKNLIHPRNARIVSNSIESNYEKDEYSASISFIVSMYSYVPHNIYFSIFLSFRFS